MTHCSELGSQANMISSRRTSTSLRDRPGRFIFRVWRRSSAGNLGKSVNVGSIEAVVMTMGKA